MNPRLRLALPLLLLQPEPSRAEAPWLIHFDADNRPTQYAGAQGLAAGIYPAIVAEAFARLREPVELRALPFRRLMGELAAGRAGAGALVRTPERLALADYSADYFTETLSLYSLPARGRPLAGWRELDGLTLGVVRGWSYGAAFDAAVARQRFRLDEVESDARNFTKLRRGHVDAVLATDLSARLHAVPEQPLLAATQPVISIGIALALPRQRQAQALLRRFDDAVLALKRERLIDAIVDAQVAEARRAPPPAI